jgi:hypothetical protein
MSRDHDTATVVTVPRYIPKATTDALESTKIIVTQKEKGSGYEEDNDTCLLKEVSTCTLPYHQPYLERCGS